MGAASIRIENKVQDLHLIGDQMDILHGIQSPAIDLSLRRRPMQTYRV
jgi:hypothetical protein